MTVYLYEESSRPRLDVSHLPTSSMDSHAPAWWGNLLMLFIETTTVILMLFTYIYLRQNFDQWPPPRTDMPPTIEQPFPNLLAATIDLVLLALACVPMYFTDQAARRHSRAGSLLGLFLMLLIVLTSCVLTYYEFKGLHFRWDDNAYGSTMWWIISLHLLYVATAAGEFFIMALWLVFHKECDSKHALDITLAGGFFYWVAATWALIYAVTYISPRLF